MKLHHALKTFMFPGRNMAHLSKYVTSHALLAPLFQKPGEFGNYLPKLRFTEKRQPDSERKWWIAEGRREREQRQALQRLRSASLTRERSPIQS